MYAVRREPRAAGAGRASLARAELDDEARAPGAAAEAVGELGGVRQLEPGRVVVRRREVIDRLPARAVVVHVDPVRAVKLDAVERDELLAGRLAAARLAGGLGEVGGHGLGRGP